MPYDYATARTLIFAGHRALHLILDATGLGRLSFADFYKYAKLMNGVAKKHGVPDEWQVSTAEIAELNTLGARGVGTIDLEEEKAHRRNSAFATDLDPASVARIVSDTLAESIAGVVRPDSARDHFEMRAFTLTNGSMPSGAAVLEEGAITVAGKSASIKFRHSKKSFGETVDADWLTEAIHKLPPAIRAKFSIKINDPGKVRVLYGCDFTSYAIMDYVLRPIEGRYRSDHTHLSPGAPDELVLAAHRKHHIRQGVGVMYDFDDFNSQHSAASMAATFRGITTQPWFQQAHADYQAAVWWCVASFDNATAEYPDGAIIQMPLGLMSGLRATSWINTHLNRVNCKLACASAAIPVPAATPLNAPPFELYPSDDGQSLAAVESARPAVNSGPCGDYTLLSHAEHAGDDIFATAPRWAQSASFVGALRWIGARGQNSKIQVSREFGEFLRVRYTPDGLHGYPARTLASLATGNFMGKAVTDPVMKMKSVAEHVAKCSARGTDPKFCQRLAYLLCDYWGAVKVDGEWHRPPLCALHASSENNGAGLWFDGKLAHKCSDLSLPARPAPSSHVTYGAVPCRATNDALARMYRRADQPGLVPWGRVRHALLDASIGSTAGAALRAKLEYADYRPLAEWYERCRRMHPDDAVRRRRVPTRRIAGYAHRAIAAAVRSARPSLPRSYGCLSRIHGAEIMFSDPAWQQPAAITTLLRTYAPAHIDDYRDISLTCGHERALAYVWGNLAASHTAFFGLSAMVRDAVAYLTACHTIGFARGAIERMPPTRTELSYELASLAYATLPTIGRVAA
jgi:hypothetical protein